MKLAYVSLVRLPTDRAHGYAMMKMCEHFAARGLDVDKPRNLAKSVTVK